jgi:hypothetical protein
VEVGAHVDGVGADAIFTGRVDCGAIAASGGHTPSSRHNTQRTRNTHRYYTAARNVTRSWSLHHGGPAAPVATNSYGNGDVSCATFLGASRETVECTVAAGHVCGRADEVETALGFVQGRRGTSSSKNSSSKSDAKVATAAAVAVVVTIVLLVAFVASFWFYRRRSRSRGIFELVDVSPVSTLAAPGIAAPSVVGKRPTPSPLRGSPPPRALRPTGALLTPPREATGGEFPS